ncbi:MAG TPA: hypothetical protein ENJ75_02980 [Candidatus Kaiserbacteria bacterium]|nr:hypothetical protein [Candidatus Kaiserbacteria bacterium]
MSVSYLIKKPTKFSRLLLLLSIIGGILLTIFVLSFNQYVQSQAQAEGGSLVWSAFLAVVTYLVNGYVVLMLYRHFILPSKLGSKVFSRAGAVVSVFLAIFIALFVLWGMSPEIIPQGFLYVVSSAAFLWILIAFLILAITQSLFFLVEFVVATYKKIRYAHSMSWATVFTMLVLAISSAGIILLPIFFVTIPSFGLL